MHNGIQCRPCCASTTLYHHPLALMKMAAISVLLSSRGLHPPYSKLVFVLLTLFVWHVAKNAMEMNPLDGLSTAVTRNCRQVQNRAWPSFRIYIPIKRLMKITFWITKIALVHLIQAIQIELRIQYDQSAQKIPKIFKSTLTKAPQNQHPKFVVGRHFLYIFSVFLNNA